MANSDQNFGRHAFSMHKAPNSTNFGNNTTIDHNPFSADDADDNTDDYIEVADDNSTIEDETYNNGDMQQPPSIVVTPGDSNRSGGTAALSDSVPMDMIATRLIKERYVFNLSLGYLTAVGLLNDPVFFLYRSVCICTTIVLLLAFVKMLTNKSSIYLY